VRIRISHRCFTRDEDIAFCSESARRRFAARLSG